MPLRMDAGLDHRMRIAEELRVIESPGIPVLYTDGACDVDIEGDNVRVRYFEFRTLCGERVKNVILEMVRPLKTCGDGSLNNLIERKLGMTRGSRHH